MASAFFYTHRHLVDRFLARWSIDIDGIFECIRITVHFVPITVP